MAYYSAFQFGFQAGFQVKYPRHQSPNGNMRGGGGNLKRREKYVPRSYEISRFERLNREAEKLQAEKRETQQELISQEIKIRDKELQRLRNLADRKLQEEIIELLATQYLMLLKQQELERAIAELALEEDSIVAIMLTMAF